MSKLNTQSSISMRLLTALIVILFILSAGGIYQLKRADALSQQIENQYMSSFHDLTDYIDSIDILLQKAMLSTGVKQIGALSSQIYMQTSAAKECLSRLPLTDVNLENTSKFLSQTGDYCAYLSSHLADKNEMSEDEFKTLGSLSEYAASVYENLEQLREQIYNRTITFENTEKNIAHANDEGMTFGSGFEKIESEFMEYPSLIYDGPFSDHLEKQESVFLKFKGQITDTEAKKRALKYLGRKAEGEITLTGETGGSIEAYVFATSPRTDGSNTSVAVTKQGGFLLWMLDSRLVSEEKISVSDATLFASRFLLEHGLNDMKETYYEKTGNVATINFAYMQDGILIYPDLIKIKVALDNGEIIGAETRGYLMCHKERELSQNIISADEAKGKAGSHLDISKIRLCVIPTDGGNEILCYELSGAMKKRNFLIYINAETGAEEKILMLIESPEGIFTV